VLYFCRAIEYRGWVGSETSLAGEKMAIYKCDKCGMSIGTMTCGECGKELVHDTLELDSGVKVDIAKCPDGHGKVKSPQCCGNDMTCSI
jgi:DNA-directed RNA polymerase subunit RPC12/RpoP